MTTSQEGVANVSAYSKMNLISAFSCCILIRHIECNYRMKFSFVSNIIKTLLFLILFSLMPKSYSKPTQNLIRHVVCFKFKQGTLLENIQKVEKNFSALKNKINGITSLEWGTNNSPENLNKEFTHCFIVTFKDENSREKYLPHPEHQAFVSILKPILADAFVIDFTP